MDNLIKYQTGGGIAPRKLNFNNFLKLLKTHNTSTLIFQSLFL